MALTISSARPVDRAGGDICRSGDSTDFLTTPAFEMVG
jgi:hypothetical protein